MSKSPTASPSAPPPFRDIVKVLMTVAIVVLRDGPPASAHAEAEATVKFIDSKYPGLLDSMDLG